MTAPAEEPEVAPTRLDLRCAECRARDRRERGGFKGWRPSRRCESGKCRTVRKAGTEPTGEPPAVDPGPPDVDGPV